MRFTVPRLLAQALALDSGKSPMIVQGALDCLEETVAFKGPRLNSHVGRQALGVDSRACYWAAAPHKTLDPQNTASAKCCLYKALALPGTGSAPLRRPEPPGRSGRVMAHFGALPAPAYSAAAGANGSRWPLAPVESFPSLRACPSAHFGYSPAFRSIKSTSASRRESGTGIGATPSGSLEAWAGTCIAGR